MQYSAQKVNRCSRAFLEPWDKCLCFNMVEVATQVLARRYPAKLSSWHGTDIARRVAPVGFTSGTGERFRAGGRDDSQSEALGDTSLPFRAAAPLETGSSLASPRRVASALPRSTSRHRSPRPTPQVWPSACCLARESPWDLGRPSRSPLRSHPP